MDLLTTASEDALLLAHPPIVEAIVDLDCDMPPGFDLASLESTAALQFKPRYPKTARRFVEQLKIQKTPAQPFQHSTLTGLAALQFLQEDERQLVQLRPQGFSFNRLAPYSSLDFYLPEIRTAFRQFTELAKPVQVRRVSLRYINRIPLPLTTGALEMRDYLKYSPRTPDDEKFQFRGFLFQQMLEEIETGNEANVVLTLLQMENGAIPLILDIQAFRSESLEPGDWDMILRRIGSLRSLKNQIFSNTLTERCLKLFQ